jgi:PAS domain S-box-containing protein
MSHKTKKEEEEENAIARLAAIVESSEDAIVSKDLNGIIKTWNHGAEMLFGYTENEVIGKSITIIIPSHLQSEEDQILSQIRSGQRISHFETIRQNKAGKELNVSITVSPVKDKNGKVIGASKIARDISEQKSLEFELQKMNEHKDEFLAILSHELRNPLATIRGGLELLHRSNYHESLLKQSLGVIERQTDHIIHIVEQLLDITLINQGKFNLQKKIIKLQDVIGVAIESCQELNKDKQHQINIAMPVRPVSILGDSARVTQIVINLISNAIKYTPSRGRINISLEQNDNNAYIRVQDNGIGIPADKRDKAFEMFHRVETDTAFIDGLGVGLGIAKKLAEMHDGDISLVDNDHIPGCEFVICLPIAETSSSAKKINSDSGSASEASVEALSKRILIIDDNIDATAMFEKILALEGFDVRTAADGETGIAIAEQFKPDICLCDIGLPLMDGYQVAEQLQKTDPAPLMIALSGWGRPADIMRSKEAGFSHHIIKSSNIDEILTLMNTI